MVQGFFVHGQMVGQLHQPGVGVGMGAEIDGWIPPLHPSLLIEYFKRGDHLHGVIPGLGHPFESQVVGFLLMIPAILEHGRLPHGLAADEEGGGGGPPQEHRGQAAHQGGYGDPLGLVHHAGHVPGVDVGNFVGQNPGQFSLPVHEADKTAVYKDVAAGHGKGIQGGVIQDVKAVFKRVGRLLGLQLVTQAVDVRGNERIRADGVGALKFQKKFFPDLPLFLVAQGVEETCRCRGGAPQKQEYQEPGYPLKTAEGFHGCSRNQVGGCS